MSSRFRAASAAMLLLALAACDREERQARGAPLPEGPPLAAGTDPRAKDYENNAYHIAQGQRLYAWMNCVGCHAHGGGGMGPPLMDSQWRYGGSMEDIVTTILQGRPNGMPSFDQKLTEQQVWQLAAYVRSLSAQPRQDVLPSREDAMSSLEPLTTRSREDVEPSQPERDRGRPK